MADIGWFFKRLKAMSIPEVIWRISQKTLEKKEERRFKVQKAAVTDFLFDSHLNNLQIDADKMHLNRTNTKFSLNTNIPVPGGYDYEKYKKLWNAGFQTDHLWPEEFSCSLEYRQKDNIGDARTNWELNRHFQFAVLAKNYAASGNSVYLKELEELFYDWNRKNPFLIGISWTSVMEIAIRCSNWCYVYCFLAPTDAPKKILEQLQTGILNMTHYITKHYSRYSSANNHLIVEAYAIGQSGILFDCQPWVELAIKILTRELPRQNYPDGINKELSLHYQAFYMEAMGLMLRLLMKNGRQVPDTWILMSEKMCSYVANCMGEHGEVIVFGDDDEGKILDLHGGLNYYQYVLGLFSVLMNRQYVDCRNLDCENLNWLFTAEEMAQTIQKPVFLKTKNICYRTGGNSIFRSNDGRILIGIDHAALGFGSIAAHGHADALSFQMFINGQPIFVDPGTYIYHCELKNRNAYRKTENHNTVCMNGEDQSQMLGAFLWGRKARCRLLSFSDDDKIVLKAEHDGYKPVMHIRKYEFDKKSELIITDEISIPGEFVVNFILAPGIIPCIRKNQVELNTGQTKIKMEFTGDRNMNIYETNKMYSRSYGIQERTKGLCAVINAKYSKVKIRIE